MIYQLAAGRGSSSLSECSLHLAQNKTDFGFRRILGSGGFRNKLILPLNDLILTCPWRNLK